MKSNSNLFIAALSLMLFLFLWDKFVISRYTPKNLPTPPASVSTPVVPTASSNSSNKNATGATPLSPSPAVPGVHVVEPILLSGDKHQLTIDPLLGHVIGWRFQERDHWVELVTQKSGVKPLETIPALHYQVTYRSEKEISLQAEDPAGFRLLKTISLLNQPPYHQVSLSVTNLRKVPASFQGSIAWGQGLDHHASDLPHNKRDDSTLLTEARAVGFAGLVKSWKPGLIRERTVDRVDPGPFEWIGVDNNSFLAAFLPTNTAIANVRITSDRNTPPTILLPLNAELKPGETVTFGYKLYVGPKRYSDLKKLDAHLSQAVDFGFFGPISKFLLWSLLKLESVTRNYGWAIVVLTMIIQVFVFPLTRKNFEHAARMRELQPQLKKLQDQFKNDPKRMQMETFNLYKKNGMRFMGMEGCFPMLLQIPIFIALYNTLRSVYELRGAPWIFWIKDLSVHDPFYVLPIIMGAGMMAQQKLTTAPADKAQAQMMMFMPILFTFMFLKLPAGLVLYWCVNSIMSILIQRLFVKSPSSPNVPLTLA